MRIATIPIGDPRWREFTSSHPSATPFHLPAWAAVIADCYRFEAFVLAAIDTDGEVLAGAPAVAVRSPIGRVRWVSLPYTDSCQLLARPDVAIQEVVSLVKEYVVGCARTLEVRAELPPMEGVHPVEVGFNHQLALPRDPADLHPHRNYRQHRNQAARKGVRVIRENSAADVATFYRLHTLTRRRLGVPVQPRRFFDLIWNHVLSAGHGFVAIAILDGEVATASIYLNHNRTLVKKFSASDPNIQNGGAGHLLDWEVMSAACAEGFHTLDFGRSDPNSNGLRTYKIRLGAVESPLIYTHVSNRKPSADRLHVGGFSKRVIRTSPPWVCRSLGEVLYRWTA